MSADNTLATLKLKDGFRIADILMIWDGEEAALLSRHTKQDFAHSEHYLTEEAAEAAAEQILEQYFRDQRVLEYGCSSYELDMTWAEYLAAGDEPLVECPVCNFAVRELLPLVAGSPEQACKDCIDGKSFDGNSF